MLAEGFYRRGHCSAAARLLGRARPERCMSALPEGGAPFFILRPPIKAQTTSVRFLVLLLFPAYLLRLVPVERRAGPPHFAEKL